MIAFIMARETWSQNLRVMDALCIDQSDRILDVGCGHGRSLTELVERAPKGSVVGVDPSELMVEIAAQRNRPLIEAGYVDVVLATVASLPPFPMIPSTRCCACTCSIFGRILTYLWARSPVC